MTKSLRQKAREAIGAKPLVATQDETRIVCGNCGNSVWTTVYDYTDENGEHKSVRVPILTRVVMGVLPHQSALMFGDGNTSDDLNCLPFPEAVRAILGEMSMARLNLCINCLVDLFDLPIEAAEHTVAQSLAPGDMIATPPAGPTPAGEEG